MPNVRITRRAHFCSAHRLYRDDWSEERNREVFGLCSNPNWHGHNYILNVTVEGPVDPETGFMGSGFISHADLADYVILFAAKFIHDQRDNV